MGSCTRIPLIFLAALSCLTSVHLFLVASAGSWRLTEPIPSSWQALPWRLRGSRIRPVTHQYRRQGRSALTYRDPFGNSLGNLVTTF